MKYVLSLIVSVSLIGLMGCQKPVEEKSHNHANHAMLEARLTGVFEVNHSSNVALSHVVYYHLHNWHTRLFQSYDEAHHFEHEMRHLGVTTIAVGKHVYYKCEHERHKSFHDDHDAYHFKQYMRRLHFIVR